MKEELHVKTFVANGQRMKIICVPQKVGYIKYKPLNNLKCYISMDSVKTNHKRNKPLNSQKYYIHMDLGTMGNCYSVF